MAAILDRVLVEVFWSHQMFCRSKTFKIRYPKGGILLENYKLHPLPTPFRGKFEFFPRFRNIITHNEWRNLRVSVCYSLYLKNIFHT